MSKPAASAAFAAALMAIGVIALSVLDAPQARAQVAAKVESQTRPNFGVLLNPPTRSVRGARQHRRWSYRDYRPDWRPPLPPHRPGGGEEIVLVDCGGNPGTGAVENAVHRLRPGGTLVLRARGGPCVGWLDVTKPITIIGEAGLDLRDWHRAPTPTLQAPDGYPCVTVAPGVRAEIRHVIFASPRGGDAACIATHGGEVVMNRVGFRHAGDEAAIVADGGLIDIRNAIVEAQTVAPAIVADGATFTAYELVVAGAQTGLELTPGAGQTSTLSASTLKGVETSNNFGPRAIGVVIRSGREYGRVEISNTVICGYVEGVAVEGASVTVSGSRICRADKGAVLYNGELRLADSRVRAASVGVAAASGRAVVLNNVFSGVRQVIYDEPRASIEARGNRVWSRHLCRAQFRNRYRDRYEPFWTPGQGWECVYGAYPRDWWSQEDGLMGMEYADDGYQLDGYDDYLDGYGWYDRSGRYVDDRRRVGDDRWSRR